MREIHRDIVSALIFSSDGKLLMGKKIPRKVGYILIVGIFLEVV
jgi:hypothetical protein